MRDEAQERRVEINLTSGGKGQVVVDGHDFSNRVFKVELVGQMDKPTEVILYMRAVEVKVMASAIVSHKLLTLDPDKTEGSDYA